MNAILILLPEHAATFMMQFAEIYRKWEMSFIPNEELASIIRKKRDSTPVCMPEFPTPETHKIENNLGVASHCSIQLFCERLPNLPNTIYVLGGMGNLTKQSMVFTVRF